MESLTCCCCCSFAAADLCSIEVIGSRWPVGVDVSREAKSLVSKILNPVPEERITIPGIREDSWFKVNEISITIDKYHNR